MMLPPFDERPKEGFIIVGSQAGLRFSKAQDTYQQEAKIFKALLSSLCVL